MVDPDLPVMKMDSSLYACIRGSWHSLPWPQLQGQRLNLWSLEL